MPYDISSQCQTFGGIGFGSPFLVPRLLSPSSHVFRVLPSQIDPKKDIYYSGNDNILATAYETASPILGDSVGTLSNVRRIIQGVVSLKTGKRWQQHDEVQGTSYT
jgi:hypothetical protein